MDMIIRFGMGSGNFKHHIQHAHATFVACLMLAFREVKAENPDARLLCFHRLYGNRIGLIFGAEPIKLVIQHLKNPKEAKQHLVNIVSANELGKAMFGETAQALLSSSITAAITLEMQAYIATDMTEATLKAATKALLTKAQEADANKLCRPKRSVVVQYRGIAVVCKVSSMLMEVELNLAAMCKERAVLDQQLDKLQFENELIDDSKVEVRLKSVAASLVARPQIARQNMTSSLRAFESSGTATLREVIESKFKKCNSIDPHFEVDACFLAGMSGDCGETLLSEMMIGHFPSVGGEGTLQKTYTNLQVLAQSPLYKFVSEAVQGQLLSMISIVSSLRSKTVPELKKGCATPLMQACLDKALFFAEAEVDKKKVYGRPALEHLHLCLSKLMEDPERAKVDLDASWLDDLRIYWWAIPAEWAELIDFAETILRDKHGVQEEAGAPAAASKKAKKSSGSAAASSSTGQTKDQMLRSIVLSQF